MLKKKHIAMNTIVHNQRGICQTKNPVLRDRMNIWLMSPTTWDVPHQNSDKTTNDPDIHHIQGAPIDITMMQNTTTIQVINA